MHKWNARRREMAEFYVAAVIAVAASAPFGLPVAAKAADATVAAAPATKPATAVKKLSVDEFDQARQAKDAVVLDVRSPEEYAAGHVPGAVNVPVAGKGAGDFDKTVGAIDKAKPVLVHCRSGVRSARAVEKLRAMGFANLAEFPGGWVAWQQAGKPAEQGAKAAEKPAETPAK